MVKVLIAEDNVILADILEFFIESAGYEVCGVASTVQEAVALADLHHPDLGIFDCRLADGDDGKEIERRMKNSAGFGIIYATGNEIGDELKNANGVAYIQKPYSKKDVLDALKIVHGISARGELAPRMLPLNFHLLENRDRTLRLLA